MQEQTYLCRNYHELFTMAILTICWFERGTCQLKAEEYLQSDLYLSTISALLQNNWLLLWLLLFSLSSNEKPFKMSQAAIHAKQLVVVLMTTLWSEYFSFGRASFWLKRWIHKSLVSWNSASETVYPWM